MLKRNADEALTALTERALLTLCLVAVLGVPSATADPAPKLALPTGDNGAMAVTVDTIRYMPERLPDTMLVSFGFFSRWTTIGTVGLYGSENDALLFNEASLIPIRPIGGGDLSKCEDGTVRVVGFFDHGGLTVFQILSFDEKMQQKGVCFQSQWDWFEHPKYKKRLTDAQLRYFREPLAESD